MPLKPTLLNYISNCSGSNFCLALEIDWQESDFIHDNAESELSAEAEFYIDPGG